MIYNTLDTRRLHYFYQVARLGSFSKAEAALDIAQPAITRQVQLLETELGVVLLLRNARGVSLTEYGRIVFEKVEGILDKMDETRSAIVSAKSNPSGEVSIGIPPSFAKGFMGTIIERFLQTYPNVFVKILEGATSEVERWALEERVDIAIVLRFDDNQSLNYEDLFIEQLHLVAQPQVLSPRRQPIALENLGKYNLILPPAPMGSRHTLNKLAKQYEIVLKPKLEIGSLALMKHLILKAPYATILPRSVLKEELERGELVTVPFKPRLYRTIAIANLKDRPMSKAAQLIAAEISREIKRMVKMSPSIHAPELREKLRN